MPKDSADSACVTKSFLRSSTNRRGSNTCMKSQVWHQVPPQSIHLLVSKRAQNTHQLGMPADAAPHWVHWGRYTLNSIRQPHQGPPNDALVERRVHVGVCGRHRLLPVLPPLRALRLLPLDLCRADVWWDVTQAHKSVSEALDCGHSCMFWSCLQMAALPGCRLTSHVLHWR